MTQRFGVLLLAGLLGTLPACGGPSQDEACTQYSQASCDALQRCNPDTFNRIYGDSNTCLTRQKLACSYQFPQNSNTTPQNFVDCAKAVPAASCNQLLVNQILMLSNLPECRPQPGTQENGSLCYADAQCQSTFCDRGVLGGLCGACGQRALLNEDCTATACDFGLICAQQNSGPKRCVAPATVAAGGSCEQDARCQAGLICVGQKCTPVLKAGDACPALGGGGSQFDACDRTQGLSCDGNTLKCVATQYVKPGGACGGAVPNQRTTCTGSSSCKNDQLCLGPAGDGQTTAYSCLPPAIGVNGVCTLPDPPLCK